MPPPRPRRLLPPGKSCSTPTPGRRSRCPARHRLARRATSSSNGWKANGSPPPPPRPIEGEHRWVAVLFANVVGLGEFADRLGPGQEDQIVASLNRYFLTMEDALRQFGGVVNKIDLYEHGAKLLAFFGAPVPHEDDAERAGRAAWAMQSALNGEDHTLQEAFAPSRLQQRIGISYGYAFAGHMGTHWRHEYTVMGG